MGPPLRCRPDVFTELYLAQWEEQVEVADSMISQELTRQLRVSNGPPSPLQQVAEHIVQILYYKKRCLVAAFNVIWRIQLLGWPNEVVTRDAELVLRAVKRTKLHDDLPDGIKAVSSLLKHFEKHNEYPARP